MMNTENVIAKNRRRKQSCADLALTAQRGLELERASLHELEMRYTEDDLVFAWGCGYESRKREEVEWQEGG
jgi:hypothetical protein